jgi:hypothetical protein
MKYYFHKARDCFKKAINLASNSDEKAKVLKLLGDAFLGLSGVQFESEFRAKYVARALKSY